MEQINKEEVEEIYVKQELYENSNFPDAIQQAKDGIELQFGEKWDFRWEGDPNDTPEDGIYLLQYSWRVGGTDEKPERVRYAFTALAVEEVS